MARDIAYSYVRFSSKRQGKGSSLHRQTQDTAAGESPEAWCRRNHVTLDTSLRFRDLGRSAWRGEKQAELLAFLEMIQAGRVRPGSCLLVERVDRITRKGLDEGSGLLKKILKAGVSIVTLANGRVYGPEAVTGLMKGWLELEMQLEAAHEYSTALSRRVRAAWEVMRAKARQGTLVSEKMPPWLEAVGVGDRRKAAVIPEKAALVQCIFGMVIAGHGCTRVRNTLIREKVRPLWGRDWSRTSLRRLLSDRAVLGEYRPTTTDDKGNRVPDGEAIENYYPAVIDPATFHKAQACLGARKNGRAPRASQLTNVFSGLLRDARSRTPAGGPVGYALAQRVEKDGRRHYVLQSAADMGADGRKAGSFPFEAFEPALLSRLREIDPAELLPPTGRPDEVRTLADELKAVEAELSKAEAFKERHGFSATLGKWVLGLEARQKDLTERLADARLRATSPLKEGWREAQSLLDVIRAAKDPDAAKLRLRGVLRRLVEEIWLLVVPRGRDRLCAVQVWFHRDDPTAPERHRDYLLFHRVPRGNQHGRGEARTEVLSSADLDALGPLDLRKQKDARQLEAALVTLQLPD
jgi:DNA invertase Pin-like site-specific DNA recombinase